MHMIPPHLFEALGPDGQEFVEVGAVNHLFFSGLQVEGLGFRAQEPSRVLQGLQKKGCRVLHKVF